jgi:hypothetical protein
MADNLGARLRTAKETLSDWYDRLNAQWESAEKTLRSFSLPNSVWTAFKGEIDESEDGRYTRDLEHCLAFMKYEGEWRICYCVGESGDPDSFSPRPILQCSLDDRKQALEGLPKLLEAIVQAAESEALKLETALGSAAESLASFKAVS